MEAGRDREPPRRNTPESAPQPKPERVNLAALAKALSEVRDSAGFVACYNRHRITEEHPDYEAVKNMFGKSAGKSRPRSRPKPEPRPNSCRWTRDRRL